VIFLFLKLERHALRGAALAAALGSLLAVAFLVSRDMQPDLLIVALLAAALSGLAVLCRVICLCRDLPKAAPARRRPRRSK